MLRSILVAVAASIVLVTSNHAVAAPCTSSVDCRADFLDDSGQAVPIYQSFSFESNAAITRVVVVVHGNSRNADDYFDRLVASASEEGRLHDTLLVAPHFRTLSDGTAADDLYWSSSGWKIGNRSQGEGVRVSSFEVLDQLLRVVCSRERYPNLEGLTVIGHSAGGQFVHRYAGGGAGCPDETVPMHYVVMNPSSYLYPSSERVDSSGQVASFPTCAGYDDYKYGLLDLNGYMRAVGPEAIRNRLRTRSVHYLAGGDDDLRDASLDTSCAADAQGAHRLDRHRAFQRFTERDAGWDGASFSVVPGVGHSSSRMLRSEAARHVMFRIEAPAVAPPPPSEPEPLAAPVFLELGSTSGSGG